MTPQDYNNVRTGIDLGAFTLADLLALLERIRRQYDPDQAR